MLHQTLGQHLTVEFLEDILVLQILEHYHLQRMTVACYTQEIAVTLVCYTQGIVMTATCTAQGCCKQMMALTVKCHTQGMTMICHASDRAMTVIIRSGRAKDNLYYNSP